MIDILFVFLSLSISGSILALILLAIKPFAKNRLSQTWQYYIWLVVILRFMLPFTPQVSIVGEMTHQLQGFVSAPVVGEVNQSFDANEDYTIPDVIYDPSLSETPQNANPKTPFQTYEEISARNGASEPHIYWRGIPDNSWLLWIGVALALFVHKVASYRRFVRFINAGKSKITDPVMLDIYADVLTATKVKRQIPLYINEQVVSPMLVGILQPALVLPVLETSDDELRQIIRHELTHFKRWDSLYKWLVQITLCLHWFNPLVYLINRQINKSCELSCDESVIKHLDEDGRITYGDALMASLTAQGKCSNFVVSITMSENVNIIKERLDMIMGYKKKSRFVFCITAMLTAIMLCGFTVAGAYAATQPKDYSNVTATTALGGITETFEAQSVKSINMKVKNCNVIIRYSVNDQFLCAYDKSKYKIAHKAKGSTVTINVEPIIDTRSTSFVDVAVIYIPERLYETIKVNGERAGVALPKLYANLHLSNNGGSMSVKVPEGFDKTIDFESVNGSGALMIDASAVDYLLKVTSQGSAVSVSPNLPAFTPNRIWEYKSGNGKAKINLDLLGSSFSIAVEEYDNQIVKDEPADGRESSLVKNFEKYKPFGVVYDPVRDAVYYNGERVRLFVDFKQDKEKDMDYAFDLCFRDRSATGSLCVEAVEDGNGKVTGVRKLNGTI